MRPSGNSYICTQLGEVVEVSMQFRTDTQVSVQICEAFINASNGGSSRKKLTLDSQHKGNVNINFTEEPTTIQFKCLVSNILSYTSVQSSVTIIQGQLVVEHYSPSPTSHWSDPYYISRYC